MILLNTTNLDFHIANNHAYNWGSNLKNTAAVKVAGNDNVGRIRGNNFRVQNNSVIGFSAEVGIESASSLTGLQISESGNRLLCGTSARSLSTALGSYDTA